jgi:hypothetical protein
MCRSSSRRQSLDRSRKSQLCAMHYRQPRSLCGRFPGDLGGQVRPWSCQGLIAHAIQRSSFLDTRLWCSGHTSVTSVTLVTSGHYLVFLTFTKSRYGRPIWHRTQCLQAYLQEFRIQLVQLATGKAPSASFQSWCKHRQHEPGEDRHRDRLLGAAHLEEFPGRGGSRKVHFSRQMVKGPMEIWAARPVITCDSLFPIHW